MTKRPSEMSVDELEALPIGPDERVRRPVTAEDRTRGIQGRFVEHLVRREVRCTAYLKTDLIGFRDRQGLTYTFGQWADGSWFKMPTVF